MEGKKYKIVNNFTDIYTKEHYTSNQAPVIFSDSRAEQIKKVEKVCGYKLIEEIIVDDSQQETNNDNQKPKDDNVQKNKKNKK